MSFHYPKKKKQSMNELNDMTKMTHSGIVGLCLLIALLSATTSALGLLMRGDGSFESVVSVRGEQYKMATTGVYAYNAIRVVAEGIGWDIFTLFIAVPVLLIALPGLARGSLKSKLFVIGLLAYFFYQYLMYAVTWAFGPLFLLFIVIYALSLTAIIWILSTMTFTGLGDRFSAQFPRRGMAILSFHLGGLLILMWMSRIIPALGGEIQGVLHGQTTMVVQALDLGLIVPLAFLTGVAAWRGSTVGYILSSIVIVKVVAMAVAILAMLLSAWFYEGKLEVIPFILFSCAAVITVWLGIRMYRNVHPEKTASNRVGPSIGSVTIDA
jgi:hypothetical protein